LTLRSSRRATACGLRTRLSSNVSGSPMHSWLLTTLRLACPVAAVSLPLLMLYGALVPWQVAEDALVEHRGSSKLLLGSSSHWHSGNGHQSETTSRTYLIIPYSLSTFNAVT